MSWFSRGRVVSSYIHKRLYVTLVNGGAFTGLLVDADKDSYEFGDVQLVTDRSVAPVDGRLIVDRSRVEYLQYTQRTADGS